MDDVATAALLSSGMPNRSQAVAPVAEGPHPYDAITVEERRSRPLVKWRHFDPDVLPLWVADMDFPIAEPIRAALRAYADDDVSGYPVWDGLPGVREALVDRLADRYGWHVDLESVLILPGIVNGLWGATAAFASRGDGVLATTPIYPPFRMVTERQGRVFQSADLRETPDGFRLDEEALDAAITPSTRLMMLCNPHNPTGRVLDRGELEALAQRALDHRLFVVTDELHADLNYGAEHVPFASLSPEIARRTVTLYGPTKAFNIAGIKTGFAVVEDPEVRERFRDAMGLQMGAPAPSQLAAAAALRDSDAWLDDTLAYLRANRDRVVRTVRERLPGVKVHEPEATYLAWLDFRDTPLADDPAALLVERARLGLNDGLGYGEAGRGFARLNFATSRAIVDDALSRIEQVLREA